jgi:membrane protein DedA with SNARE-associated domain
MEQHFLEWLVHYGAAALFAAQVLGIFGLPIPDEFLLTLAGALVKKGDLSLVLVVLAAIGGSGSGITLSYVLGRTMGVIGLRRVLHVHQESLKRAERLFERFGGWLLGFGYFIPGVRHFTAILAGSTQLDFKSFAKFAYPGAILWSIVFLCLGYYAGDEWRPMLYELRTWLPLVAVFVFAVLVVVIVSWRRISTRGLTRVVTSRRNEGIGLLR